jgi:F-type H+-transporting ATPase subunit b
VRTEAREEGDRIIQRAREEISRERDTALREVRGEVAGMVIEASQRVLGREVNDEEHERLISEALDSLEAEMAGGVSRDGSQRA